MLKSKLCGYWSTWYQNAHKTWCLTQNWEPFYDYITNCYYKFSYCAIVRETERQEDRHIWGFNMPHMLHMLQS